MIDPREWTIPQLVVAGLGLTVVFALLFAATTSATAFGAYNYAWDGSSDLRDLAGEDDRDTAVLQNTSAYDRLPGNDTIAVVLGPDESYDAETAARIRSFVRRGGTVLVAADFGTAGNDLLADIGATVRVDGSLVRDERNYDESPALPIATNVSIGGSETANDSVDQLVLNYPSFLTGTDSENVTVLARTSPYAYVDRNRNDELDDEEELGSYPVIAREPVGNGSVIAVSDPSLFINSMLERGDNRAAVTTLLESYDRVRFDYTHSGGIPPIVQLLLVVRSSRLAGFVAGILSIGFAIVLVYGGPGVVRQLRRSRGHESGTTPGLTEAEMTKVIAERHPEWDRDRIRRIAAQLASRRSTDE